MSFLNPALLLGAALLLVPLIIHLLNRQRHIKRPWAAMEYLLRAYQKQRNRVRRENLLLLLLRCLLPVVLALAIARPILRGAGILGSDLQSAHHIAVLDASYSMGYERDGAPSPFERGRTMVTRLLENLADQNESNPRVSLLVAGTRTRVLCRDELNLGTARMQWLALQRPEDGAADLVDAAMQAAQLAEESTTGTVHVYLLSDLQRRALGRALSAPGEKPAEQPQFSDDLRDAVARLQAREDVRVHLIDVGPFAERRSGGQADNLQLTDMRLDQPAAIARVPMRLFATVRNRSTVAASAQVTLEVDGSEPTRRSIDLPPDSEGELEFSLLIREPGTHRLRLHLQNDGLGADDELFRVLQVRDRIRVLVVDGSQETDPLKTNAYVWQNVLDPTAGEGPPELCTFAIQVVDGLALLGGQVIPAEQDIVVLADVERVNETAAEGLRAAMRAGKGVLFAFGPNADLSSYNLHLHEGGEPLLPVRLLQKPGNPPGTGTSWQTRMALPDHAAFREFDEPIYREVLQAIPVHRWVSIDKLPDDSGAQVLAQLTDPELSPLLVAGTFAEGRTLVWLSGPTSEFQPDHWNRFADPHVVFHLLHGFAKWLALPAQDPFNVEVGAELACSLPARPVDLEIVRPEREGGGRSPSGDEPRPLPGGRYALPPFAQTLHAGFYTFEGQLERDVGREPLQLPFAVNVDPEEGQLTYAAHADVRTALNLEEVLLALPGGSAPTQAADRSELGPTFLWALLLVLLGEAGVARLVSVRRR